VIDYLQTENRVLREHFGTRRLRVTDDQRVRLAAKARNLRRRVLQEIGTIVSPDTLLAWHRHLIARKYDGVRCENSSRCPDVLVNHAAETIATLDTSLAALLPCCHEPTCRAWRPEAQRSMRPVAIVMIREHGEDPLKMLVVQDQEPVETFGANSPHKSLRHAIRLRGAKRRANDLRPNASKHLVKTVGEFLVPVADQEAERLAQRGLRKRPGTARRAVRRGRPASRRAREPTDSASLGSASGDVTGWLLAATQVRVCVAQGDTWT
jgi:hypothetical protein